MAPHLQQPLDAKTYEQRRIELQSKGQCRFCMKTDANLCYIYTDNELNRMLQASFAYTILKEDAMPRYCCEMCHKMIVICQRFRAILQTSEQLFTEYSSGQSERCPDSARLGDTLRDGAECRLTDHSERGIKRIDRSHPLIRSGTGSIKVISATTVNPNDYVELFVVIPPQEACISAAGGAQKNIELRSKHEAKPALKRRNFSKTERGKGSSEPDVIPKLESTKSAIKDEAQPRMLEPGSKVMKFLIPYKQEKDLQLEQGVNIVIARLRELKIQKDALKNQ